MQARMTLSNTTSNINTYRISFLWLWMSLSNDAIVSSSLASFSFRRLISSFCMLESFVSMCRFFFMSACCAISSTPNSSSCFSFKPYLHNVHDIVVVMWVSNLACLKMKSGDSPLYGEIQRNTIMNTNTETTTTKRTGSSFQLFRSLRQLLFPLWLTRTWSVGGKPVK